MMVCSRSTPVLLSGYSCFFPEQLPGMSQSCLISFCIIQPLSRFVFLPFSWTTSGLKSQGRLSVGSNRDREISMSVGLGRSKLDSKGGVVGGNIDVNTLEMVCKSTDDQLS